MKSILHTLSMLCLGTLSCFSQNILTVDNHPGSDATYDKLQVAINSAQEGDTIYVQNSNTSYGDVTVNKKVNIIGRSHLEKNNITYVDAIGISPQGSGSYFSGIKITETIFSTSKDEPTKEIIIENCYINRIYTAYQSIFSELVVRGCIIDDIGSGNNSNFYDTSFINNIIIGNVYFGLITETTKIKNSIIKIDSRVNKIPINNYLYATTDLTIENCMIIGTANATTQINYNEKIIFKNCLTYSINGSFYNLPGDNNLNNMNPEFINIIAEGVDPYEEDYHLKSTSPAIGKGTDGKDIGLYNGGYNFNLFGLTYGIPLVEISSISSTVQEGQDLQIIIKATTN